MLRSLLVPLDGSPFGEYALPIAASLARRAGATLHLAHVHHVTAPESPSGLAVFDVVDLHQRQDEQAYLADVARRVASKGPLSVETILLKGDVVASLKEFVQHARIDLVVLSTHARGPLSRLWRASVADELALELTSPVLLIRAGEGKPDLNREVELKSIVVPLDGDPLAERAVAPAAELARFFDAQITLVRVNQPVTARPIAVEDNAGMLPPNQLGELAQRQTIVAQGYLDAMAAKLATEGTRVRTHVVMQQQPADGILEEAEAAHADLIAIETHGRRGLARLLFGSVADRVVRGGEVPVLLHHSAQ